MGLEKRFPSYTTLLSSGKVASQDKLACGRQRCADYSKGVMSAKSIIKGKKDADVYRAPTMCLALF